MVDVQTQVSLPLLTKPPSKDWGYNSMVEHCLACARPRVQSPALPK